MVTVVEFRHIAGGVFGDDGETISLAEELSIFKRVESIIQTRFPLFRMRIIICGLKIFGRDHIQNAINAVIEADRFTKMVVGFDMVNEEDYNMRIDDFLDQIIAAKMQHGDRFQVYLHAGESYQRSNTELHDAILLGTKRIGHGFGL